MQKKKEEKKVSDDFSYHITQVKEKIQSFMGCGELEEAALQ